METSTSEKTPMQEQIRSWSEAFDRNEDLVVQTFRCLGLEDSPASGNRLFPAPAPREYSPVPTPQWLPGRSHVPGYETMWGSRFFSHGGESSGARRTPAPSNARNYDLFRCGMDVPYHHGFGQAENRNPYRDVVGDRMSMDIWWQDPLTDLARVRQTLRRVRCPEKDRLVCALLRSVVKLMTDQSLYLIFEAFLEACGEGRHFGSLVEVVVLDKEAFVNAAFCTQGVYSMTKLIRKLKRSPHASTLTRILSERFLDLATDYNARKVVNTCFIQFRHETNEILYELAISHCHYLARDKLGCRTLNECISTISGEHRLRLLDKIADIADILCDDHFGNYVLQTVVGVDHGDVNAKILNCLRGKFVQLAQRQVGSHTVEKCMEISKACVVAVIKEILKSPRAPLLLAEHTFGNYVVQKALTQSTQHKLTKLCNALVISLRPHLTKLMKTTSGRSVVNVINGLSEIDQCNQPDTDEVDDEIDDELDEELDEEPAIAA